MLVKEASHGSSNSNSLEESHEMCVCIPVEHHGRKHRKPRHNTGARQDGETMTREVNGTATTGVLEAQDEQKQKRQQATPVDDLNTTQTQGNMRPKRCRRHRNRHYIGKKSNDDENLETSNDKEKVTGCTASGSES